MRKTIWLMLLAVLLCLNSVEAATRTVKVAYTDNNGFIGQDENDIYGGYATEYLQKIAKYTGWRYEYVYIPWNRIPEELALGNIDIICNSHYTPERAEHYIFSAYSGGTDYCALYALKGSNDIFYADYQSFAGKTIGVLRGSYFNQQLAQLAAREGFSYQEREYDWPHQMRAAITSGEVDMIALSAVNVVDTASKYKIVGKFAYHPFFFMMSKNNAELMKQLDNAVGMIKAEHPAFEEKLYHKYYSDSLMDSQPMYTRWESEFVQQTTTVKIAVPEDRPPLCFYDKSTEKMRGAYVEILRMLEQKSGLHFELVQVSGKEGIMQGLFAGKYDAALNNIGESTLLPETINISDELIEDLLVGIAGRELSLTPESQLIVAIPAAYEMVMPLLERRYPSLKFVFCDNEIDCINALHNQYVDAMMCDNFVAAYLLQNPRNSNLHRLLELNLEVQLRIFTTADNNRLAAVLNKTINVLTDYEVAEVLMKASNEYYPIALTDFLYHYRVTIAFIALLLLFLGMVLRYVSVLRLRNLRIIRENEARLYSLTNNINGGVVEIRLNDNLDLNYVNDGFLKLLGYSQQEYQAERGHGWEQYVCAADLDTFRNELHSLTPECSSARFELRMLKKDGQDISVLFSAVLTETGGSSLIYCVLLDNTEQKMLLNELETEKERYRIVIENSRELLFDIDFKMQQVVISNSLRHQYGMNLPRECHLSDFIKVFWVHPEDKNKKHECVRMIRQCVPSFSVELRIAIERGQYFWAEVQISVIGQGGRVVRCLGRLRDIDEEVRERQRLLDKSQVDALSTLYNKETFTHRLQVWLDAENNSRAVLLFIDIDNFKEINDVMGHMQGDEALRTISRILRENMRAKDLIARFGGDEFCILMCNAGAAAAVRKAAELTEKLKRTYYHSNGREVKISASIGIACYPQDGMTVGQLLANADKALYAVKASGKNGYQFYDEQMTTGEYISDRKN